MLPRLYSAPIECSLAAYVASWARPRAGIPPSNGCACCSWIRINRRSSQKQWHSGTAVASSRPYSSFGAAQHRLCSSRQVRTLRNDCRTARWHCKGAGPQGQVAAAQARLHCSPSCSAFLIHIKAGRTRPCECCCCSRPPWPLPGWRRRPAAAAACGRSLTACGAACCCRVRADVWFFTCMHTRGHST